MMVALVMALLAAAAPPGPGARRDGPAQLNLRGADVDMDARADAKRDEAIEKLERLLPTVSEGPQKAEIVFRLSEMYWAKSKYNRLRAMQAWDASLEKWAASGKQGTAPTLEREPKTQESAAYRAQALKLYAQILEKYPSYERRDEVLYSLASAQYDNGELKVGVETFWTLIKEYPDSGYAADAWLQLGEHFFNTGKLVNAVKAYEAAAATKRPRVYAYATYKLAWCDFNLQDYSAAAAKFRAVVAYAKEQRAGGGDGDLGEQDRLQLLDEALGDMVRVYSHIDALDDAFAYYQGELPPAKARLYLRRLAKRYDEEGKYLLEIKACSRLIDEEPDAVDAPQLQVGIVSAYAQLGRNDDVRREVRRLIDVYSPGGAWAQRNASNAQAVDAANGVVEQELAKLVTEQHRAAQQTKLTDSYMLARDLYREYLEKFPSSPNAARFRFFYADIAYELKDFPVAAEQFSQAMRGDPKDELTSRAAYMAILAWDKVVSGTRESVGSRIAGGKSSKRVELASDLRSGGGGELSPAREKLVAACDAYVLAQPTDQDVPKIRFKAASTLYAAGRYEDATARFQAIIAKHPKDPLARTAAEAILESLGSRKDWAELARNARLIAGNRELMADRAFADRVADYVQAAAFNDVLYALEPKGDHKKTAEAYSSFVREFPKSKYVSTARYNAMLAYDKAHDLDGALAVGAPVAAEPGDDEVKQKIALLTAELHERVGTLALAAQVLERRARDKKDVDLLLRAAADREGAGDFDAAVVDYLAAADALRLAGKDVRGAAVAWRAGLALEAKHDAKAAHAFFERYGNDYAAGDEARRYCADYAAARWAQEGGIKSQVTVETVARGYERLSAKAKREPCVKSAAAAAAFAAIEDDYQAAMAISLTGREPEVAQKLVKKLAAVDAVQKRYTQVLALGEGSQGIAALYRIGTLYKNLSKAMFDSPCPKRLNGDQCAIYHQELGDRAFPLEERAIEAFDKATLKAYELGLYDDWLAKSQEALRSYEPKRFAEPPPAAPMLDPALMPPAGGAS